MKPSSRHHRERADQRHRDREDRNDRGPPGLQEQDHDQHDEQDRLEQRVHDGVDRVLDELGRVVDDGVVDARAGSPSSAVCHRSLRRAAAVASAFEPGRWKMTSAVARLVFEIGVDRVILRAELDAGDVAHPHYFAVRLGTDDDVFELVGDGKAAQRLDLTA